ncbi:hypothetical protein [Rhodanobacter hydrolyticus]|uniref:Uncharacterized protein n=1 Tax=Rhodanobacter hydrolyticus TaxID=2250595 RepID=A0ABW8J4F2_9GAMM
MSTKHISQREARALKRRVAQLEAAEDRRRNCYAFDWPGGTHIGSLSADAASLAKVDIARRLKHAVVCTAVNGIIQLYALPISTKAYEEAMG